MTETGLSGAICLQVPWNRTPCFRNHNSFPFLQLLSPEVTYSNARFANRTRDMSPCNLTEEIFEEVLGLRYFPKNTHGQYSQHVSMQLQAFCKLFNTLYCRGKLPVETESSLSRLHCSFHQTQTGPRKSLVSYLEGCNQLSFVSCLYWGCDQLFICFFSFFNYSLTSVSKGHSHWGYRKGA